MIGLVDRCASFITDQTQRQLGNRVVSFLDGNGKLCSRGGVLRECGHCSIKLN